MRRSPSRVYLVAGAIAVLVHLLLPRGDAKEALYLAIALSGLAALLTGILRNRPKLLLPWMLTFAGVTLFLVGEIVKAVLRGEEQAVPVVTAADGFFVAAFAVLVVALMLLYRRVPLGDRASLIDAAVITIGVGLLCWVPLMSSYAEDTTRVAAARALTLTYPLCDLLLVALASRLVFRPGSARTTAHRLLLAALISILVADVIYAAVQLDSGYRNGDPVDELWILGYVLLGAAALHPSMRTVGEATDRRDTLSRGRVVLLALASLIAVAVLAVQSAQRARLGVPVVAVSSAVLFLLVLTRMVGLVNELRRAQEQRGRLLDRTVQAREEERMRLAAELHDGPIQRLAFLTIDLELARRNVTRAEIGTGVGILDSVQARLTAEIGELRRVMAALRPPLLDEVGLTAALRDHMADFEQRVGVRCELHTDVAVRLDPTTETVLYRVTQEALINVGKHANASTCRVVLHADQSYVELCVHDDGSGFDTATVRGPERGHYGLVGMRERVELAGGRCEVSSRPGSGVTIRVTFQGPASAPPQPPPTPTPAPALRSAPEPQARSEQP
jgi:signal transduction histidine kinase